MLRLLRKQILLMQILDYLKTTEFWIYFPSDIPHSLMDDKMKAEYGTIGFVQSYIIDTVLFIRQRAKHSPHHGLRCQICNCLSSKFFSEPTRGDFFTRPERCS
jgi:hypothetical protein